MNLFHRLTAAAALLSAFGALIFYGMHRQPAGSAALVTSAAALAAFFSSHPKLKSYAFTVWVAVFVTASLFFPKLFGVWFGVDLSILIVPLIQIIMFGMGTTLSAGDFSRVIKMPVPVFIGFVGQYTIMPLIGLTIASLMQFEPEVAAGVVLVGSCPGGVASNLISYLAGGNVALSVTMTACSTLASPFMTPFLMKTLAGRLVPIDFTAMMLSILNMIIVPIAAGLFANKILYSKVKLYQQKATLGILTSTALALATLVSLIDAAGFGSLQPLRTGLIVGFSLIGITALAKLIIQLLLKKSDRWMDRALPLVSMIGICFIIAIITARSSEKLLSIGLAVILAAVLHNLFGYALGYGLARLLRQNERDSRTIAVEVGMQNAGMASGLAMSVLKSAPAALAPAVFGPWMNVSGSILANYWQKKPIEESGN
ncbi:MAG: bile acid:sodium symporter family protein [candidate division KSB1 bacterium]|nr:bile acid:sodium symporter family protein [candidate division KSB1 bacterium]MDZ7347037.1 bile acid:sodium symporter family protein [candidate division KSB1 bacterium]